MAELGEYTKKSMKFILQSGEIYSMWIISQIKKKKDQCY